MEPWSSFSFSLVALHVFCTFDLKHITLGQLLHKLFLVKNWRKFHNFFCRAALRAWAEPYDDPLFNIIYCITQILFRPRRSAFAKEFKYKGWQHSLGVDRRALPYQMFEERAIISFAKDLAPKIFLAFYHQNISSSKSGWWRLLQRLIMFFSSLIFLIFLMERVTVPSFVLRFLPLFFTSFFSLAHFSPSGLYGIPIWTFPNSFSMILSLLTICELTAIHRHCSKNWNLLRVKNFLNPGAVVKRTHGLLVIFKL